MKPRAINIAKWIFCTTALSTLAIAQTTENYLDATGEVAVPGNPFPHLDITSVDVTVDAEEENITFKINLNGSPVSTNWGKYMIGIRNVGVGAAIGNGWGRPINFSAGMTHWIGGWADGDAGGLNLFRFVEGSWVEIRGTQSVEDPLNLPIIDATGYSVTVPVELLNLVPGQVFTFDVYSSGGGGGDGAVDSLSAATASITDWPQTFTTTSPLPFTMPGDFEGLDPLGDEDNDGYLNGDEEAGNSSLGYVSDPLIPNYTNMSVTGSFNLFDPTNAGGVMEQGATSSLITQYHWTRDYLFDTPAQAIQYKFTTNGSYDINWGQGSQAGAVVRNSTDIAGFVGPSGVYRFFFDQGTLSQTFERRTFDTYAEFRAAYGLVGDDEGQTADSNLADGWTDHQNFLANTNPLAADTDGDGIIDSADAQPLVQQRVITFKVDMNVQIAEGNFDDEIFDYMANPVKLLVFTGESASPDPDDGGYPMEEVEPGVFEVSVDAKGFAGQPFGDFKFHFFSVDGVEIVGTYEERDGPNFGNRSLTLGPPNQPQTFGPVFFSDDDGTLTFESWAEGIAWNGGDATRTGNPDGDAFTNLEEFLFGTNPVVANGSLSQFERDGDSLVIRWNQLLEGATYSLLESDTLGEPWVAAEGAVIINDPDQSGIDAELYIRRQATVPIVGDRNFFRVSSSEGSP